MLHVSSGADMTTFLLSMTSWISMSNPFLALASTTSPVVVKGSRKMRDRGMEYAEGSVLSAMKNIRGSDPLSSKDISAEPGPAPLTFPEKASVRMSCPAAYSFMDLAILAAFWKHSHAAPWTSLLFSPL